MRDALADALLGSDKADRQVFRVGTVTKTIASGGALEVTLAGGTTLTSANLASYTPTIADTVLILQTDSDLCIMGKLVSGA